ncbi:MAG: transglutaminase TgpA family protein [Actinopolymorphaceae bacterium]
MSEALRSTIAGLAATFLACLALVPAYQGQEWLGSAALVMLFVTATGFGLRQLGTPHLLVPLGQLAALGWAFVLVYAHEDLRFGFLPSGESVEALTERINEGLLVVVRYAAPVPYDADLVMVTAMGIGLVAITVDTMCATFRLAPWAGLPLLLLYSIPATTVSGGISALAFIPAAIGYIVLLVSESRDRLSRWGRVIGIADDVVGPQDAVQASMFGQTGRRVGAMVIGLAVVVPALMPALPAGLFGQGEGGGFGTSGQTIKVDNPIVDLRRDLRLPQNVPVLNYRTTTDTPDYIKLVTLDVFDGERWRPSQRSVTNIENDPGETSRLPDPPGLSQSVPRTNVRTRFQVTDALESKWLPSPYPATTLNAPGEWGYDPDTIDIVSRGRSSASGLTYDVSTLKLGLKPAELDAAGNAPAAVFSRYTELPTDLPKQVKNIALREVGDAKTNYDKAIALQTWFRTDFSYNINVEPGHSESAMLDFLADRRGYCEQFAATMAIMARSLGIPARVGVGYMAGTRQPDNRWLVTAHDSHAWPELYFAGYGWVRFEPTPQAQTGLAPSWTVPDRSTPSAPSPEPTSNPDDPSQNTTSTASAEPLPGEDDRLQGAPQAPADRGISPVPFLVLLGVLLVGAVPFLIRTAIRQVRLSSRHPTGRLIEGTWRELADATIDAGLAWDDAATPRATGIRLRPKVPQDAIPALEEVVQAVERSRYAPDPGTAGEVTGALKVVTRALRSTGTRAQQVRALLLPPSLWRQPPRLWRPVFGVLDRLDSAGARSVRQVLQLPWHRRRPPAAH